MKRSVPLVFLLLLLAQLMYADDGPVKNYMIPVRLKEGHDKVRIEFNAPEKHRIYTYRNLKGSTVTFYTSSIGFIPKDIVVQQFDSGLDMLDSVEMKDNISGLCFTICRRRKIIGCLSHDSICYTAETNTTF